MMWRAMRTPLILALLVLAAPAIAAETCRTDRNKVRGADGRCRAAEKVRPYEPDRVRAGSQPGFVDLGGGTEVRIGGRVRADYDARR